MHASAASMAVQSPLLTVDLLQRTMIKQLASKSRRLFYWAAAVSVSTYIFLFMITVMHILYRV